MAIALDSVNNGTVTTGNTSYSHTCSGNNRILFVGIRVQGTDIVTTVTYNSVSMTLVGKIATSGGGGEEYLYYLIAPATGVNTIAVTVSDQSKNVQVISTSYTGAKQSGQPDASTQHVTTTNALTTNITTIADNCWTVSTGGHADGTSGTLSAGTGVTLRAGQNDIKMGDSNGVIHPPGSTNMTWNSTMSEEMVSVMASFAPALSKGGSFLFNFI